MRRKRLLLPLFGACSLMLGCSSGWQIKINGTANGTDLARAVAVTYADDVVAAGLTENAFTFFGVGSQNPAQQATGYLPLKS